MKNPKEQREIKEEIFDDYEKQVDMEERKQRYLDKSINPKDWLKKAMEYASCVDTQRHLKKCKECKDKMREELIITND